eukprot:TRINITY_DN50990_c0_g1_i1.p1 TRINITY_DN50990_c0_g1~~TRINITY_DN50990_c0_g1_i1.p1  ORF type:complete len:474 (-),score=77.69 TRINITY_DN50990_c0_g1_i1:163-1482(-)
MSGYGSIGCPVKLRKLGGGSEEYNLPEGASIETLKKHLEKVKSIHAEDILIFNGATPLADTDMLESGVNEVQLVIKKDPILDYFLQLIDNVSVEGLREGEGTDAQKFVVQVNGFSDTFQKSESVEWGADNIVDFLKKACGALENKGIVSLNDLLLHMRNIPTSDRETHYKELFPGLCDDNLQRFIYFTRALSDAARLNTEENYAPRPGTSPGDVARIKAVLYGPGSWEELQFAFVFCPQLGVVRSVTRNTMDGWDKVPTVGEMAKDREGLYARGRGNMSPPPSCMDPEDFLERIGELDEIDEMLGDAGDATSSLWWSHRKPERLNDSEQAINLAAPRRNAPTRCVRLTLRQKDGADSVSISADWVREGVQAVTSVKFEVESVEEQGTAEHQRFRDGPFRKTYATVRCSSLQDATDVFCKCFDAAFPGSVLVSTCFVGES